MSMELFGNVSRILYFWKSPNCSMLPVCPWNFLVMSAEFYIFENLHQCTTKLLNVMSMKLFDNVSKVLYFWRTPSVYTKTALCYVHGTLFSIVGTSLKLQLLSWIEKNIFKKLSGKFKLKKDKTELTLSHLQMTASIDCKLYFTALPSMSLKPTSCIIGQLFGQTYCPFHDLEKQ